MELSPFEKPAVTQPLKILRATYGTWSFTKAYHFFLAWATWIQLIFPSCTSKINFSIFSHLLLGLPTDLFPSECPTKCLQALFCPIFMLHAPPSRPDCHNHSNYISREVQASSLQLPIMSSLLGRIALLIFYSLTPSVSILPLISETKFLTNPKVRTKPYFCVFILFYFEYVLNLYVFGQQERRKCVLNRKDPSIALK
jgi:hypothetical protein